MLAVGTTLPTISGRLSDGTELAFGRPTPGPLVIFFFPKAFAPTCIEEVCGFRDAHAALVDLAGARVIGVSRDSPDTNQRFKAHYQLPFDLLSDEDGAVARAFDAQLFGGTIPYAQRVTYVADPRGRVRGVFNSMFDAKAHIDEAKALLEELPVEGPRRKTVANRSEGLTFDHPSG